MRVAAAPQRPKQALRNALALLLALAAGRAGATLVVTAPAGAPDALFYRNLSAMLDSLAQSSDPVIRRLHDAAAAAPGAIRFREMTDDPATWSSDGDPQRGHTEPDDGRPKREGRSAPTDATVFVPPAALEVGSPRWRSGLLVHELVHALDLASGRYNRDYTVRERRATFMQNLWRHDVGSRLRTSYHGRFATLDYQVAAAHGTIAAYANEIFTGAGFPKPPGAPAAASRHSALELRGPSAVVRARGEAG